MFLKIPAIKTELEGYDDSDLHRLLFETNWKIKQTKQIMESDPEVLRLENEIDLAKSKYKIRILKLKTYGEQLLRELASRDFKPEYALENDDFINSY